MEDGNDKIAEINPDMGTIDVQYYFSGAKRIDEVCAVIENRVRLYLKER